MILDGSINIYIYFFFVTQVYLLFCQCENCPKTCDERLGVLAGGAGPGRGAHGMEGAQLTHHVAKPRQISINFLFVVGFVLFFFFLVLFFYFLPLYVYVGNL